MLPFVLDNNVKSTTTIAITSGSGTIGVNAATQPFKDPQVKLPGNQMCAFTLVDNEYMPTKIEIVYADEVTDLGGVFKLSGLTRGAEGTLAQSWDAGTVIYQSITAHMVRGLLSALYEQYLDPAAPGVTDPFSETYNHFITAQQDVLIDGESLGSIDAVFRNLKVLSFLARGLSISPGPSNQGLIETTTAEMKLQGKTEISNLRVTGAPPANSSATVPGPGRILFDSDYIYVSVGVNNWKRVALSAF